MHLGIYTEIHAPLSLYYITLRFMHLFGKRLHFRDYYWYKACIVLQHQQFQFIFFASPRFVFFQSLFSITMAAFLPALVQHPANSATFSKQKFCQLGSFEMKQILVPSAKIVAKESSVKYQGIVARQSDFALQQQPSYASIACAAATISVSELFEKKVDYNEIDTELLQASPLEIMDKALSMFDNDIAIAFSGAEDVALIEYAKLTGRSFRVFSLDTGRLNPETYQFFAEVEKYFNIHIEYMFPEAEEVQSLVRSKGLFSFYEDGHQECCRVRKVRPLRKALKSLKAWITGQRKDQSPGTRANVPIVQVDPSFEGLDGGVGSLVKWNPLANVEGKDVWKFLQTMNVPVNSLHYKGYVSIGCEPCTRPVLPGQHEREGRWWWEDAKAKECGLHKGNIESLQEDNKNSLQVANGAGDLFSSKNVLRLNREGIERLTNLKQRKEPWLVVLYAPWCKFCQAMEVSYDEVALKLRDSGVKVAKFRADGEHKSFAQQHLQLGTFPTILLFPKHSSKAIKYPSEKRDVDSLLAFVKSLQ